MAIVFRNGRSYHNKRSNRAAGKPGSYQSNRPKSGAFSATASSISWHRPFPQLPGNLALAPATTVMQSEPALDHRPTRCACFSSLLLPKLIERQRPSANAPAPTMSLKFCGETAMSLPTFIVWEQIIVRDTSPVKSSRLKSGAVPKIAQKRQNARHHQRCKSA